MIMIKIVIMISMIMLMINNHDQENNHYDIIIQDGAKSWCCVRPPQPHQLRNTLSKYSFPRIMVIVIMLTITTIIKWWSFTLLSPLLMIIIDNHPDERHAHGVSISLCVCTTPSSPTYPPARGGTVSENLLRIPLSLSNQHDYDDEKPQITKKWWRFL